MRSDTIVINPFLLAELYEDWLDGYSLCELGRRLDLGGYTVRNNFRRCGYDLNSTSRRSGITTKVECRFWAKVEKTDSCWLWKGHIGRHGYGYLSIDKKHILAHRVSWRIENGSIPEGLHVLHHCDVRDCVNPSHLFTGTRVDNMQDKISKGRGPDFVGSKNPFAKLTEDQVLKIRSEYSKGQITQKQLSIDYSVDPGLISQIVLRKVWKHV